MKKIVGIVFLAVLLVFAAGCVSTDDENNGGVTPPVSGDPVKDADKIAKSFGSYNGKAIEWRVLTVDKKNEKALLLSSVILEDKEFHEDGNVLVYWESSSLREWLNEDFFNAAFTAEEQKRILDTSISIAPNSEYGTTGGNPTVDKVFLLSEEEANRYFADEEDRKSESLVSGEEYEDWWLRNSGESEERAAVVFATGSIYTDGFTKDFDEVGVRPAVWVDLSTEA